MAASHGKRLIWSRPCVLVSDHANNDSKSAGRRKPYGKLYGRRKGRGLKPAQEAALRRLLPALAVPLDAGKIDPFGLFEPRPRAIWLEIGFGAGEHLLAQSKAHPDIGIIGCEAFLEGVAKLVRGIELDSVRNVRVHAGDAREMLSALPQCSVDRVFLLFPDPWPKSRHHKRRFVSDEVLQAIVRIMRSGAELRVATDWPDYVRWTLLHVLRRPELDWLVVRPADWRERPADWPETRYARKAHAAGRQCFYLRFLRR